jgi:regulator of nucleoside diphosphate kinase
MLAAIQRRKEQSMQKRTIYITELDMARLRKLLSAASTPKTQGKDKAYLKALDQELQRGVVVPARKIPNDVITMNSTVRFTDLNSGEEITYSLVFPADADIAQNKISVLAPIGTAMLGYRVGDIIEWEVPAGARRLRIEEILYQPEAAGRFDL